MPEGRDVRVEGPVKGERPPYGSPPPDVLAAHGYVCEEYRLSGTAVAYAHAGTAVPGEDGRWEAEPYGEAPYRTRLLVLRPAHAERCNGTVLLHWQNVSAGAEQPAPRSGETYRGYVWVGVSAQIVGLHGLPMRRWGGGALPLLDADPTRYVDLVHPGEPGCFEIFSGAAEAVRPARTSVDVDPLDGLAVARVVATGGSQSAMRLCAYANALHQRHRVVDGYVLSVWEGRAPHLDDGPLPYHLRTTIRSDLDVPVLVVNSEFEATATAGLDLDDHDRRRIWEVTGTAHGAARATSEVRASGWTPNPLSWRPVHDAAIRAVHRWLAEGEPPACAPRIAVDVGPPARVLRDEDGNAFGGIRLPEIAVPVAEHRGSKGGTGSAPLFGGRRAFTDDVVRVRHRSRAEYRERWERCVEGLVGDGFVLAEDAAAMAARGAEVAARLPLR